ncbi:MAG: amidohydrolase family protein [Thermodesulfovibrionales bacterium]|jgi:hypothetical protein
MEEKNQTSANPEIIDIHCHAAGIGAGQSGCYISPAMLRNWRFGLYLKAFGVTEAEVHERGDALVIQRLSEKLSSSSMVDSAVILALDCVVDEKGRPDFSKTELYVPNEFVCREVRKYDNLYFGASIHPYRKNALDELQKAYDEKAALIKWLPSVQHIDPADNRLTSFYHRMRELGLPLLTHTGDEHSFTTATNILSDPERLRLPLDLGVTVIAAHVATNGKNGGQRNFDRILPMFSEYSNLYADISSLTQLNKVVHLKSVLRHKQIHDRLLYGTDMPILSTAAVSPLYFVSTLGLRKAFTLRKVSNAWDQDVNLKQALGVPRPVFGRASVLFGQRLRIIGNRDWGKWHTTQAN